MIIADIKKSAEQKMQKSVEALKHDLGKVRTGRAHTGLLDHIQALGERHNALLLNGRGLLKTCWCGAQGRGQVVAQDA